MVGNVIVQCELLLLCWLTLTNARYTVSMIHFSTSPIYVLNDKHRQFVLQLLT